MKTVVVGLSGGVDSAVVAYLLKEQGFKVIGLFMRNWDALVNNELGGQSGNDICPQEQDYNDALKVCETLKIPLHRVDFIKEYWDYIFTYFLEELKQGRTPNPDLLCNKYIKFDLFIDEAKKLGADYIATGHYARVKQQQLYKAFDQEKDQTYFLSQVSREQFKNILFPLGILTKKEVRLIATKFSPSIAQKRIQRAFVLSGNVIFKPF